MFRAVQPVVFAFALAVGSAPTGAQLPPPPSEEGPAAGAKDRTTEPRKGDRLDRLDPETEREAAGADRAAAAAAFVQLDANGDGRLTHEEAEGEANLPGRFEFLDADRDGTLNREEFEPYALRPEAAPGTAPP